MNVLFWIISIISLFIVFYLFGIFKMAGIYIMFFAVGTIFARMKNNECYLFKKFVPTASALIICLLSAYFTSGAASISNSLVKMVVSFSVIVVTYILCNRLSWNQYWDKFIQLCGVYSLSIYVVHWTFLNIGLSHIQIVQNELIAFIPVFLFAVLICITCIQCKRVISYFPLLDFLLFGVVPKH